MKAAKVVPVLPLIKDAAGIAKAIDGIAARGKKLDRDIHIAGVSVLSHAYEHGDITLANRLLDALPKSGRRNAMLAWLTSFGPFKLAEDSKHVAYSKLAEPLPLAAAIAEPFYEFAPEPVFVPFDFKASIEAVLKKAEKALADDVHKGEHAVSVAEIASLRKLIAVEE